MKTVILLFTICGSYSSRLSQSYHYQADLTSRDGPFKRHSYIDFTICIETSQEGSGAGRENLSQ